MEFVPANLDEALERVARETLEAAGLRRPPIDAVKLAEALGLCVALDARQEARGRFVRLRQTGRGSILVRPEPRAERLHWAIAHEIGESLAARVFAYLAADPTDSPPAAREAIANKLAGLLLLPTALFPRDASSLDWDLAALKQRYATASHELIARRMLDFEPPSIVTVIDAGRQTWRLASGGRAAPFLPVEKECLALAQQDGAYHELSRGAVRARCWPIHEPQWRREILRTDQTPEAEFETAEFDTGEF